MEKRLAFLKVLRTCLLIACTVLFASYGVLAQDLATTSPASRATTQARADGAKLKAITLQDFMQKFQRSYGIYFSYKADSLKETMVIYAEEEEKQQADAGMLLKRILNPAGLTYEKANGVYIIKPIPTVASLTVENNAPMEVEFTVSGVVRDANGPLEGVNVSEKGKAKGTITNFGGKFTLNVSGADAILVFTYVGYKSIEVPVQGRAQLQVVMEAGKAQELSNVVVTALGITRQKKALGYSVGEIKGDDMNRVNQTNALNSMAGKVSGVTISTTSNAPNASVSMVIRGIRSLNSDNQPLFVIDGVPVKNTLSNISNMNGGSNGGNNDVDYGNTISDLNPNDIESVSILKGPSAAALYGSRAGNGVVLITTKSGKKSKGIGVTFSTSDEFQLPYKYLPLNEMFTVGTDPYTTPNGFNSLNGTLVDLAGTNTYRFGTPLNIGLKAIQWNSPENPDGTYVPQDMVSHNNLKNFMQTGITSVNSIAIENATDRDNYRLSYTNTSNRGITPSEGLVRHNLSLNIQHKVNDALKVSSVINYARSQSDNIVMGNNGFWRELAYLSPSVDVRQGHNYWITPGIQQRKFLPPVGVDQDPSVPDPTSTDYDDNPWFVVNQVKNGYLRNQIYGNIKADYQFSPHWSTFVRYSQDLTNENRETKISKSYTGEKNGYYSLNNIFNTESNTDFLTTYKNDFGDFNLSASVGGNIQYVYSKNLASWSQSGAGIIAPEFFNLSNISQANLRAASAYSQKAVYSLYSIASLGYKDMVFLDVTGRNDWSSTLPASDNSYFYPSASLSVLLNKMINFGSAVDLVKLRGGWASVGKDTDPYNLYGTVGIGSFGGITTETTSSTIKNAYLKPEQAISTEFGIDLAFLKNRLRFGGTIYRSDNKNQVLGINTPPSSGFTSTQINAGLVRSNGIELELGGTLIQNKDWTWNMTVNYTHNNAYVISLAPGVPYYSFWQDGNSGSWTYAKGQAIPGSFHSDGSPVISDGKLGQLWDNKVLTVTDKTSPYYQYPLLDNSGQYQKVGGGAFNQKEVVGNYQPKLLMGMQTSVSYKAFTLTASFDMRLGGTFFSQTYRYMGSDAAMARQTNVGIKIPTASSNNIPGYLKANDNKYVKYYGGLQQFHLVGGYNTATGGFPYTDNGNVTINDGAFFPGVYSDGNGGYVENLGDPNLTKYDNYEDAVTAGWGFARMAMFDASYIKLRELTFNYELPRKVANAIRSQGVSFGLYTRNIVLWTKAKNGIDPETAYELESGQQGNGSQFRQGIERYNILPWSIPMGVKLSVRF
ncbi:MAG: SusC/RagA family TonB-linked outer membrane protein [Puia sp.]|nr:SusC/RagA family TonB-linked outer membrane protein [Puia sp.]